MAPAASRLTKEKRRSAELPSSFDTSSRSFRVPPNNHRSQVIVSQCTVLSLIRRRTNCRMSIRRGYEKHHRSPMTSMIVHEDHDVFVNRALKNFHSRLIHDRKVTLPTESLLFYLFQVCLFFFLFLIFSNLRSFDWMRIFQILMFFLFFFFCFVFFFFVPR